MSSELYTIIVGGDLVPIGDGEACFAEGDARGLVGEELLSILSGVSFAVFNLESPLISALSPIEKCGPNLGASVESKFGLRAINLGAFSLANNHIMDHGEQGLFSTMESLGSVGAPYFGAGASLKEAQEPYIARFGELSVGFIAFAEHEFSIAGVNQPGANPYNPLTSFDDIKSLSMVCDRVIVLYHGGKEYYRYPSPKLQARCQKMVEAGADVVICQHSHCVGCVEEYKNGSIIYGQGNFLFDDGEDEFLDSGLLLKISFSKEDLVVSYIPVVKTGFGVRLAEGDSAASIMEGFQRRSEEIQLNDFVENEYAVFADNFINSYLSDFLPGSKTVLFRALNRLFGGRLSRIITSRTRLVIEMNRLECESHNELFLAGIKGLYASKATGGNNERDF